MEAFMPLTFLSSGLKWSVLAVLVAGMFPLVLAAQDQPDLPETVQVARAGFTLEPERTETGAPVLNEVGNSFDKHGGEQVLSVITTQTANPRLCMDGGLSDDWSAGAAAFLGFARGIGAGWRHDLKLLAAAAHSAVPRDPITLLQGELRQRAQGGVGAMTAIASVYRLQCLSDAEFLNLRYGLKHDRAKRRSGTVTDVMNLLGAECRSDLSKSFDTGLHGSVMHAKRVAHSAGLSLGDNVTAFHAPISRGLATPTKALSCSSA
jgi:hypothetical protein